MSNIFVRDGTSTQTQETVLNVLFVIAVVLFAILMLCMGVFTCTRSQRLRRAHQNDERIVLVPMSINPPPDSYTIVGYLAAENKQPGFPVQFQPAEIERVADSNGNISVFNRSIDEKAIYATVRGSCPMIHNPMHLPEV